MATEAQIKAKVKASGRNWDQKCQALAWNLANWFGHAPHAYISANAAYHASKIVSHDASKAPSGSWHYWAIGAYGHVAFGLGGTRVLMGSKYVDNFWGENAGVTTVGRYSARTGARYLGWSTTNGGNDLTVTKPTKKVDKDRANVKKVAAFLNNQKLGKRTTAVDDGVRGDVYWLLVQKYAHEHLGYTGSIDGDPGPMTRAAEKKLIDKVS